MVNYININDLNFPSIELLEAQRQGKLLLFCGAGVSKLAGLPDFSELVKELSIELTGNKIPAKHNKDTNPALKILSDLYYQGSLDRALSFLETYEETSLTYSNSRPDLRTKRRNQILSYIQTPCAIFS